MFFKTELEAQIQIHYRTLCVLVSKQLFKEYPEHGYYHSHLHLKMNKNYLNAIFSCDKKTEAGHLLLLKAKNIKVKLDVSTAI